MKKPLSIILLSSAILLPNQLSAEASYYDNAKTTYNKWSQHDTSTTNWNQQLYRVAKSQNWYVVQFPSKGTPTYKWTSQNKYQANKQPAEQPIEVEKPAEKPIEKPAEKPAEQPAAPAKPAEQPTVQTPQKPAEQPAANANLSATEQAVLDLTNAERAKAGLKPLQIDAALQKSARQKSTDMATKNYFSHTSPTYGSPFDQMKANGITYRSAAENIAMGQRTAQEVVNAWMNSEGHRKNILTPGFTHIGIGHDANGNYWTQQFIQK